MKTLRQQINRHFSHLGKADLHIHSNFSDGKPTVYEILDYVQNETDLSVIAITDHNTIEGALLAQKYIKNKKYRFDLVIGEEVSSLEGHIIALYIKKAIPAGLSAAKTLSLINEQGGLAIAAHPFYTTRMNFNIQNTVNGVGAKELIEHKNLFTGLETVNATPLMRDENMKAKYLNRLLLFKAETGSSDAHILEAIGKGYTLFEGHTKENLEIALRSAQTQALNDKWDMLAIARYAFFYLPLGLRLAFHTLVFGPVKPHDELIKFPSRRRIAKEINDEQ